MYRWYVTDPIRFKTDLRVTMEHGHANDLGNDYSSTAFWYQAEPHAPFPALLDVEARLPRCSDAFLELYAAEMKTARLLTRHGDKVIQFLLTLPPDEAQKVGAAREAIDEAVRARKYDMAVRHARAMYDTFTKYDTDSD